MRTENLHIVEFSSKHSRGKSINIPCLAKLLKSRFVALHIFGALYSTKDSFDLSLVLLSYFHRFGPSAALGMILFRFELRLPWWGSEQAFLRSVLKALCAENNKWG